MDVSKMSVRYKGCTYWRKNKEWYTFDESQQRFFLTNKAPVEARRSFELYKLANWRYYKDRIIDYERI